MDNKPGPAPSPTKTDDGSKDKTKDKDKDKDKTKDKDKDKDPKKQHAALCKEAMRVKASYMTATQRADEILRETKREGKFQWARDNPRGDKMILERLDTPSAFVKM